MNSKIRHLSIAFLCILAFIFSYTLARASVKDLSPLWNFGKTKIYSCYADENITSESAFYPLVEAQQFYNTKDYEKALESLDLIINNYATKAKEIQSSLQEAPWMSKEDVYNCRELNAVGTALLIKGLIYLKLKNLEVAGKLINEQISSYSYAHCWNPDGWFVRIEYKAEELLDEINHRQGKMSNP